jgi:DNA-binding MarR family transcriptional regulator
MASASRPDTARQLVLDNQLCFALYSASLGMTRVYKPLLAGLGLTYPQYIAMLALWERDGLMVSELGERLFLDSGTLTPLLKRMEANGLLTRTRDPADERCVRIALSPQGRALKRRAAQIPAGMRCPIGLPAGDLGSLREQLHALLAAIEPPSDES